ncbi:hypothetical protein WSM22_01530 [Cytophagales bacterium WSM2-2]|nr:hypothetical protein WSM22_01530 [Cytophagales bacterium WSM2-2]
MFASPTFASFLITVIVATASSLLVWREEWVKTQEEKKEQALQKIAAELTALKLQISPHFLFNTLNNIRWLVRSKSDKAEDAVVKLSHLLRYILYQTESEQVDLEKEIEHLSDFIELQKMRIAKNDPVHVIIDGSLTGKRIVPLLLLPLVENFFKHGDFNTDFQNSISLQLADSRLVFKSENWIAASDESDHGIGLTNVMRRLELHYPKRHLLKYFERNSVFYLELELMLSS